MSFDELVINEAPLEESSEGVKIFNRYNLELGKIISQHSRFYFEFIQFYSGFVRTNYPINFPVDDYLVMLVLHCNGQMSSNYRTQGGWTKKTIKLFNLLKDRLYKINDSTVGVLQVTSIKIFKEGEPSKEESSKEESSKEESSKEESSKDESSKDDLSKYDDIITKAENKLKEDFKDVVRKELKEELREQVKKELEEEIKVQLTINLKPFVIAELKIEHREEAMDLVKDEVIETIYQDKELRQKTEDRLRFDLRVSVTDRLYNDLKPVVEERLIKELKPQVEAKLKEERIVKYEELRVLVADRFRTDGIIFKANGNPKLEFAQMVADKLREEFKPILEVIFEKELKPQIEMKLVRELTSRYDDQIRNEIYAKYKEQMGKEIISFIAKLDVDGIKEALVKYRSQIEVQLREEFTPKIEGEIRSKIEGEMRQDAYRNGIQVNVEAELRRDLKPVIEEWLRLNLRSQIEEKLKVELKDELHKSYWKENLQLDIESQLKKELRPQIEERLNQELTPQIRKKIENDFIQVEDKLKEELTKVVQKKLEDDLRDIMFDRLKTGGFNGSDHSKLLIAQMILDRLNKEFTPIIKVNLRQGLKHLVEVRLRRELKPQIREQLKQELEPQIKEQLIKDLYPGVEKQLKRNLDYERQDHYYSAKKQNDFLYNISELTAYQKEQLLHMLRYGQ